MKRGFFLRFFVFRFFIVLTFSHTSSSAFLLPLSLSLSLPRETKAWLKKTDASAKKAVNDTAKQVKDRAAVSSPRRFSRSLVFFHLPLSHSPRSPPPFSTSMNSQADTEKTKKALKDAEAAAKVRWKGGGNLVVEGRKRSRETKKKTHVRVAFSPLSSLSLSQKTLFRNRKRPMSSKPRPRPKLTSFRTR